MGYNFRDYNPNQLLLLAPNLDDWLPQEHMARFISDVVDALDLKPFLRAGSATTARAARPSTRP